MSTQRQHRRLDKIKQQTDTDSGPLVSFVDPGQEPDPPNNFQSEEALRSYFYGRDGDPSLVIFAPVPEEKQKGASAEQEPP